MDDAEKQLKKLKNPNPIARANAIIALAEMGDERALPAFINNPAFCGDKTPRMIKALDALAKRHPDSPHIAGVVDAMVDNWLKLELKIDRAAHRPRYERVEAFSSFSGLGAIPAWTVESIPCITNFLEGLGPVATPALLRAYPEAVVLSKMMVSMAEKIALMIAKLGPEASDALLDALYGEEELGRNLAAEALITMVKGIGIDQVSEVERKLGKRIVEKTADVDSQIKIARLQRQIAIAKNERAPKRDIMLEGKPRPPKAANRMWQATRRMTF